MAGFFTKEQTQSIVRPDGKHLSCNSCGLYKQCNSPKMQPYGGFEKGIMCIGEAPSEEDDIRGKQWQGKDGALLRQTLAELGVDLFKDCISLNAINCRPKDKLGKYRKPEIFEIDCCRRIVLNAISLYKPKVIILFGGTALRSVIGNRWKKDLGTIDKWSGFTIPDQDLKTWICPVFHPSYVLAEYKKGKQEVVNVWEQDLQRAINTAKKQFPVYVPPTIHYLKDGDLFMFEQFTKGIVAFDYETTGLKPHAKGHQIVCASVAINEMEVYVFMMPKKRSLQQSFITMLENPNIEKIGHNCKYETMWTYNCLHGAKIKGWKHDTMLGAHILDNRTGITSLKYQVYVNFGVVDYDSEINPILNADDQKNANSTNKLLQYVKSKENAKKVMEYCALDSIFTLRLCLLQINEISELGLPF